jgi:hypothetical protein
MRALLSCYQRTRAMIWELPQNVLGALNLALQRGLGNVRSIRRERGRCLIELSGDGAVSLGWFVFYSTSDSKYVPVGPENVNHEYGHSVQSRWLGPLYLPLVGVPSTMRVLYAIAYRTITGRRWGGYYNGWPERQADRLGRVDVSQRPPP